MDSCLPRLPPFGCYRGRAGYSTVTSMSEKSTPDNDRGGPRTPLALWILICVPAVLIVAVGLFFALIWFLSSSSLDKATQAANLSYFDIARSVVVLLGIVGAAVGLVVAWRRQSVQEHQLRIAERDLRHREGLEETRRQEQQDIEKVRRDERSADQLSKSLENLQSRFVDSSAQLGHTSAAIRLAGAYAMSQLASEWNDLAQRQSCVDVLCAYLRMPARRTASGEHDSEEQEIRNSIVRLIAQRLQADTMGRWSGVDIDLSWAILDACNFDGIVVDGVVRMVGTKFEGDSSFKSAYFNGLVEMQEVIAEGSLVFTSTQFRGGARFSNASLGGHSSFSRATFGRSSDFFATTFESVAVFSSATFDALVDFSRARFLGTSRFLSATFTGDVKFEFTHFHDEVIFSKSVFGRGVGFVSAQFLGPAFFVECTVLGRLGFGGAFIDKRITFEHAIMEGGLKLKNVTANDAVALDHVIIKDLWHLDHSSFAGHFGISGVKSNVAPRTTGASFSKEPKWENAQIRADIFSESTNPSSF
jgi:uncharacterized protein YjbI with pentapeptide repeats